jgi:predicted membrane-bound spermidine synthase
MIRNFSVPLSGQRSDGFIRHDRNHSPRPFLLPRLGTKFFGDEAFLLLSGLSGYLVGLEFPLSSNIFSGRGEGVARTAGILYAADLFGAWGGSLLVGVLFIPVLGILQTCAAILFLKLASLSLVVVMHRPLARLENRRPGNTAAAK